MAGSPSEGGLKRKYVPALFLTLGAIPSLAWASQPGFAQAAPGPVALAVEGRLASSLAFSALFAGISLAVFFIWRRERRLRTRLQMKNTASEIPASSALNARDDANVPSTAGATGPGAA